jgi:pimeloyl-ACP methyl ester carboxylesterase
MTPSPTQPLAIVAALTAALVLAVTSIASADPAAAQARPARPTIVLVHGAWADATGWQHVIPLLEDQGFPVVAVQNTLTSLTDDVATTRRALAKITGPIVLVAHSYGGFVITEAGAGNPQIVALVYVAAFIPALGDTVSSLGAQFPSPLGAALVPDAAGCLFIDPAQFRAVFAADVPAGTARIVAIAQKQVNGLAFNQSVQQTAWKTVPSWDLLTLDDQAINPDLQRFMTERAGSHTLAIHSSHVAFVSHPQIVAGLIETAARATWR